MHQARTIYGFGPYELDESRLELRRDGRPVDIQGKPLALLLYLAARSGCVVSQAEILREVWPDVRVEPGALKSAVHVLRRTLGAAGGCEIKNVHGQGYCFVGALRRERPPEGPTPGRSPLEVAASDFVEREVELGRLRVLCHAALRGERQVALISGPPGIGKTRLAMELAREVGALGFDTHVTRTHCGAGAPPFWPWSRIVESWTLAAGAAPRAEREDERQLAFDLSGLEPAQGPSAAPIASPFPETRFRMFHRVSSFVERASRERPLLLILDDLDRADTASIELLLFLSRQVTRARVVVLATHRTFQTGHLLGRVLQEPATCSIPLSALQRSSIERVLERSLGAAPAPELIDRVRERSGGNPLFVHELSRALGSGELPDGPLPERVHDAVRARLSECSPACLKALRLASVMGSGVTLPILAEALAPELDPTALLDAVGQADRLDLLTFRSDLWRFVHGAVRESLLEQLAPIERTKLRQQIDEVRAARSRWAEPSHPSRPVEIATTRHGSRRRRSIAPSVGVR